MMVCLAHTLALALTAILRIHTHHVINVVRHVTKQTAVTQDVAVFAEVVGRFAMELNVAKMVQVEQNHVCNVLLI